MLTDKQINDANAYGEWLRLITHDRDLPANNRTRASAACFAIAEQHHHAIIVLLEEHLYASAFALMRVAFDAYVRGMWLAHCAKEERVQKFLDGERLQEMKNIQNLLNGIEQTEAFKDQNLSALTNRIWAALCDYTHTGGRHVQRWNTSDGIEPNYSSKEVLEVLKFSDIVVTLSTLGLISLMNDENFGQKVLDRFRKRSKEYEITGSEITGSE